MRAIAAVGGVFIALVLTITISGTGQAQQELQNIDQQDLQPNLVIVVVQFEQRTESIARLMVDGIEATKVKVEIQDSRYTGVPENLVTYFGEAKAKEFNFESGDIGVIPLHKGPKGCRLAGKGQLHKIPMPTTPPPPSGNVADSK